MSSTGAAATKLAGKSMPQTSMTNGSINQNQIHMRRQGGGTGGNNYTA